MPDQSANSQPDNKAQTKSAGSRLAASISTFMAIGVALGAAFGDVGLGIAIGIALGAAIGLMPSPKTKNGNETDVA